MHAVAADLGLAVKLYGFFHNPCIHESMAGLVSLHASKAGAWRAMRARKWELEVGARDWRLHHGLGGRGDKSFTHEWFGVEAVEVLP